MFVKLPKDGENPIVGLRSYTENPGTGEEVVVDSVATG